MKYVVYEVWTTARVIEANDPGEAYAKGEPAPRNDDLNLSNWHIVPIAEALVDGNGFVQPKLQLEDRIPAKE